MRNLLFILMIIFFYCCSKTVFQSKRTNDKAPKNFITGFETSKETLNIQINRPSSPMAVDCFYQFIKYPLYDNTILYHVIPNFAIQFSNLDTTKIGVWNEFKITDEKVLKSNIKRALSYARDGKDSSGNDLFINIKNNSHLDTINYKGVEGFLSIGTVIKGLEVVEALYSRYGNSIIDQHDFLSFNPIKFIKTFSKLDSINKVYMIKRCL